VLLVFGAPCQLRLLARQEHGRTIPLADMRAAEMREPIGCGTGRGTLLDRLKLSLRTPDVRISDGHGGRSVVRRQPIVPKWFQSDCRTAVRSERMLTRRIGVQR
jgi:hypothetical protein